MEIIEIFEESLIVLKSNKMRTILSILGIVIGIGSVISLMSLGQASKNSVEKNIQSLGSNLLTVIPGGGTSSSFIKTSNINSQTLTYEDALDIANNPRINTVKRVAPEYSTQSQVSANKNNENVQIIGVTPEYKEVRNIEISYGSFISENDNIYSEKVAVIGPGIVESIFENQNPLGQKLKIDNIYVTVIGVTKSKGGFGRTNPDDSVYIPLNTANNVLYGNKYITSINVEAISSDLMQQANNQIGFLLLERHKISSIENADFSIQSQADILETMDEVTSTFTTLLTGIAAISLVVGGIGIMNIMLVTVTERTREIGLRKSLGAKKKTIIYQFLVESSILTLIGGIIGMFIGIGASYVLTKIMSLEFIVVWSSIILAVLVSTVIGIVFGLYPAKKASNLLPIEALRYE